MQTLLDLVNFFVANYAQVLGAIVAVLVGLVALLHAIIAVALMIPGEQPEKALQSVVDFIQKGVDFLTKFSKK